MTENITLHNHMVAHCKDSMKMAISSERHPSWERSCPEMNDIDFIRFGLLRCINSIDSGRHFLVKTETIFGEVIPLSTYFNSIRSSRRTNMLEAVEVQSYKLHCKTLASQGVDYLKNFPELDQYNVEAADGHFVAHACHTEKGTNDKVYAAGFIYSLNLRNGLLKPLCNVTNGTQRNQEIPALRSYIEGKNNSANESEKRLFVYDKAATDYAWWDHQKKHENYLISVVKENSAAVLVESIEFDKSHEINIAVEHYSLYENKGVKFSVVEYRDPETQKLYRFVTTLPTSINPGTIALLYFKRWTIEKAFNNSKSDLKETKAWSSNTNALKNQMRLTSMTYNQVRVFEELSKVQDDEFIHPSDKKYTKDLEKRNQVAKKSGYFVNPLFFQARITRICSNTIRMVQDGIMCGKSLVWLMNSLTAKLIPRHKTKVEH